MLEPCVSLSMGTAIKGKRPRNKFEMMKKFIP